VLTEANAEDVQLAGVSNFHQRLNFSLFFPKPEMKEEIKLKRQH